MNQILTVDNVTKAFDSKEVLKNISFSVNEGECVCLLGHSGSGKSTLLQIISGLLSSDSGVLTIENETIFNDKKSVSPEKRNLNMVFQNYALWPHMTAKENIEYGLKRKKMKALDREKRIEKYIKMLQLNGLLSQTPSELSGGQQQRVGIARALATNPKVLLMDEPLSNLDVKLRTEMRAELSKILKELSVTTIYVTHDILEAFSLADRIIVLDDGKIAQFDTPQQIFDNPATKAVAELLGFQNTMRGKITYIDHDKCIVEVEGYQFISDSRADLLMDDEIIIMSQIEEVSLYNGSEIENNVMEVKVTHCIYEGHHWRIRLQTKNGINVELLHNSQLDEESYVKIKFNEERTKFYKV